LVGVLLRTSFLIKRTVGEALKVKNFKSLLLGIFSIGSNEQWF
jgi:hypothetical protein